MNRRTLAQAVRSGGRLPLPEPPELDRISRVGLDHLAPALEGRGVLGGLAGAVDGGDHELLLRPEVVGTPGDFADIQGFPRAQIARPALEPADQLVLPADLGEWPGGPCNRPEDRGGDL